MIKTGFDEILHPCDFSRGDQGAFAHALKIALAAEGRFCVLHVGEPSVNVDWADFPHVRSLLRQWRVLPPGASKQEIADLGLQVKKVVRTGKNPVSATVEYVARHPPNLVVLATHQRRGLSRWMHQAVAEPIARNSRVMTLFVPRQIQGFVSSETGHVRLRNILIPVTRSPSPRIAIQVAASLARVLEARDLCLRALHVGPEVDSPAVRLPEQEGWRLIQETRQGDVVETLVQASEEVDADLLVMATQGQKGFLDALRGSITERVLHQVKCPLLAVPWG